MTIARLIASKPPVDIVSCEAANTVREAIGLLAERRIGALPVHAGETLVGIFSERDVLYCLAKAGAEALDKTVGEVMTATPITVEPATPVLEALALMTRRRIRHLPVMEGGRTVAFISIGDLVKFRMDHITHEAEMMRSYIQSA